MKKIISGLLAILLLSASHSHACVGKILNIGILNSVNENFLAELVSVLVNERTGTIVNIKVYSDSKDIYDAVKNVEVSIIIENTERASKILNISKNEDNAKAYDVLKEEFRNRLNLIWLKPFGMLNREDGIGQYYYVPVITDDVLINFPALPRLINKLGGSINDDMYTKLINSVESGGKPRTVARDFLKSIKLI
ncbi:MAG: hypothetical protein HZB30_11990 [Nitrospirae bacterium]|nr:hypothetical protein [Nitrospirota bacterium]